jgi:hypothetical protein
MNFKLGGMDTRMQTKAYIEIELNDRGGEFNAFDRSYPFAPKIARCFGVCSST